ncbi:hypothetical protein BASA81_009874 [Batrachochytrium salamandrivorans]|nr:hypothetical protein BASA81_009874 [Batrachochytrium salamandrivorans]
MLFLLAVQLVPALALHACCPSPAGLGVQFGSLAYSCSDHNRLSYKVDSATGKLMCSCSDTDDGDCPSINNDFQFQCQSGRLLPLSKVNDNFCDCGDDEPNTSACVEGVFFCHASTTIVSSSKVGDGVKDCCDCSDETYMGGGECMNTCAEEQAIRDQVTNRRNEMINDGWLEAQALMATSAAKVLEMQMEVDELRMKKLNVDTAHKELDSTVGKLVEEFNQVELELWVKVNKELGNGLEETIPVAIVKRLVQQKRHREFFQKFQTQLTNNQACNTEAVSILLDQLDLLASQRDPMNLAQMDRRITQLTALLQYDFGPNQTLVSLLDQDFSMKHGEHTFTFKAFDACMQGPANTNLGKFQTWHSLSETDVLPQEINEGEAVPKPSLVMEFTKGQACYQGTIRTTQVFFRCGFGGHALIKIFEPEMCRYVFLLKSPIACLGAELFSPPVPPSLWKRTKRWLGF